MSENPAAVVNGLDDIPPIKTEPIESTIDPLLDTEALQNVIPKEFTAAASNGLHEDSDCEDISFFTQIEVDNTRKCLENTRLIIKDFETQLDWHLQQYMTLRNIFNPRKSKNANRDDSSKRQDLLSISQLSAIIANHPEGNKKFIKRKGPISNGTGGRKRRRNKESETEEESDFSEEESEEFDEEDFEEGNYSDEADDPKAKPKRKTRSRKGKNADDPLVVPKDEIEEEIHELVLPKEEKESEEEMDMDEDYGPEPEEPPAPKKQPAKRGRKPKAVDPNEPPKTPAKRGPKGKRGQKNMETIDLTNLKTCKVMLSRIQDEETQETLVEIKNEEVDRDDLVELLQPKFIMSIENFYVDPEKPIVILKDDNVQDFDFNECKTSNVIATFEHIEALPEFLFIRKVANHILNGFIKVVLASVFDQHLGKE